MIVYVNGKQLVIETNVAWALPYWQRRRALREDLRITWKFIK